MASALSEQAFQIEIEDGLKYDIRIQNSALDRYFHFFSSFETSLF